LAVDCLAIGIVGDIVEGAVMEGIEAGYVGIQGINCVCYIRTLTKRLVMRACRKKV
jgi:hypothetical protein